MVTKKKSSKNVSSYSPEFRREVVRLHLEEGYNISMLASEFGCGKSTLGKWVKLYKEHGDAGLLNQSVRAKSKLDNPLNTALKSRII